MTANPLTPRGAQLRALIDGAPDYVLWLAGQLATAAANPVERDAALRTQLAPLLAPLGGVAVDGYVKDLARLFGCSAKAVREALGAGKATDSGPKPKGGAGKPPAPAAGPADPGDMESQLAAFGKTHAKVWFGDADYILRETTDDDGRPTMSFSTSGDVTRHNKHITVKTWDAEREQYRYRELAKEWEKWPGCRTYNRVVFRPQGATKRSSYNLWRGFAVDPAPGDCSLYWQHLEQVICSGDAELYTFLRRWLAHSVQRTHELPGSAIILRGQQGTGKGAMWRPIKAIFGSHALGVHNMELVSGRFSGHLKDVIFLLADEAFWGGDKSREGLLKGLITEPHRMVEPKHKDAHQVDNYVRLLVFTNNDWPVARDHDDRRNVVVDVPSSRKEDEAYFDSLEEQMANGGTAALLHDLLAEDLSDFNPRVIPQRNTGWDIKIRSSSAVVQWWHECLMEEANRRTNHSDGSHSIDWSPRPNVADLHDEYRHWCNRLNRKFIESRESWARELRKMAPHLRVARSPEGNRQRQYVLGDLSDCRTAFQLYLKCTNELWDDDPTQAPQECPF